jgi:hypothetical protein
MTDTTRIPAHLEGKDGQLIDALEHELRRLPDDAAMTERAIDALNAWLSRSRVGTFNQFLRRAQGVIRSACHPERKALKADALRIDPAVIGSPKVREVVEKELLDSEATALDLKRVHEGLTQLKAMPDAKEPWKSILMPFTATSPTDGAVGFTPQSFLEAAKTVVWTALGDYS